MANALNINHPAVLRALGRANAEPFREGDRCGLQGQDWEGSVRRLSVASRIENGCVLYFVPSNDHRPGRPVLVTGADGIKILGEVPSEAQVLAVANGIDWP